MNRWISLQSLGLHHLLIALGAAELLQDGGADTGVPAALVLRQHLPVAVSHHGTDHLSQLSPHQLPSEQGHAVGQDPQNLRFCNLLV